MNHHAENTAIQIFDSGTQKEVTAASIQDNTKKTLQRKEKYK